MTWTITDDFDEYLAKVGPFLRREPVTDTLIVTIVDTMRAHGANIFTANPPLMGWWKEPAGDIGAALIRTPPFPAVVSRCSAAAAKSLVEVLATRREKATSINLAAEHEAVFAGAVTGRTGAKVKVVERQRLYRLGRLRQPDPEPPGRAYVATDRDRALAVEWFAAYCEELGQDRPNPEQMVDARLPWGGIRLWQLDDGVPVAMAGMSRPTSGMTRIGPVYTLPDHRGRGYGAGVTAALSQGALELGVGEVLLFTDLGNPTSNRVYQRIGYEAVSDRVILGW